MVERSVRVQPCIWPLNAAAVAAGPDVRGAELNARRQPECAAGSGHPIWRSVRASVCHLSSLVVVLARSKPQNRGPIGTP
jgi:hypothetical protein